MPDPETVLYEAELSDQKSLDSLEEALRGLLDALWLVRQYGPDEIVTKLEQHIAHLVADTKSDYESEHFRVMYVPLGKRGAVAYIMDRKENNDEGEAA